MSLSQTLLTQIYQLRSMPGRIEKEAILKANADIVMFRKILLYTYSPYIRFHIRKIPAEVVGDGHRELNQDTWTLLNKLALRKLTGIAARETLFEYMESLTPAACTILRLVIGKDLKAGVATKTINKIIPGLIPVFDCQLVEDWVDGKVKWPLLIGPKLDGTRGEKRGDAIYSRRGHQITGIQHVTDYISTVYPDMMTSGELWIPGMPFRRSNGIIKSNKPEKPNVKYAIFDIPSLPNVPLEERLAHISKSFYPLESHPSPPVVYIPHILVNSMDEVDRMYNYWRSKGYEGLVAKNPKGLVRMGKSYEWMRRVAGISLELKILGVYESDKKPGTMGGIIVEGGIRVGSGFVDAERIEYLKHPERIIGKLATIDAKERTAAGSLRQPIFKAIRWDI